MTLPHALVLLFAAMLAGAVNSVAGGGTLLTFPALLWVGQAARVANATSTVALWPGQLSSLFGYRSEIGRSHAAIAALGIPSLIGGVIGARLLIDTRESMFAALVPYLILVATLLFTAQEPISRFLRARAADAPAPAAGSQHAPGDPGTPASAGAEAVRATIGGRHGWLPVMGFQLCVAVYGGYFGAGIGILMLAELGFMGFRNIHQMNGLKNLNGLCINLVAALIFIARHLVDWRFAGLMALGSIVGGYCGAGTARRIGQKNVRRLIIMLGFCLTLSLLLHRL